jgi:hypothetical protein
MPLQFPSVTCRSAIASCNPERTQLPVNSQCWCYRYTTCLHRKERGGVRSALTSTDCGHSIWQSISLLCAFTLVLWGLYIILQIHIMKTDNRVICCTPWLQWESFSPILVSVVHISLEVSHQNTSVTQRSPWTFIKQFEKKLCYRMYSFIKAITEFSLWIIT